jgi:predicted Zn-dependent protease
LSFRPSVRQALLCAVTAALLTAGGVWAQQDDIGPLTEHDMIDLTELPDFGDSAGAYISPEQERLLGQGFMRQMRRRAPLVSDEEVESGPGGWRPRRVLR